jgi:hypothetical protein
MPPTKTTKTRIRIDTARLNFRLRQWPITVFDPLDIFDNILEQAITDRAAIDIDRNLTSEGKVAARPAKRDAALKAIADIHSPRLAGIEADVAARRAALIPANVPKPSDRQIDFLLSRLRDRTALEISTLYNSATDDEKMVLEKAARTVGRIPTKRADGSLVDAVTPCGGDQRVDQCPGGGQGSARRAKAPGA